MTRPRLRIGIIGAGVAGRRHAAAYASLPDVCELVGVHDPHTRNDAHLPWVAPLDDLLAGCDAVSICSPSDLHTEHLDLALAAGRHVLVEKPFATGIDEALCAVAAVDSHPRLVVQVAHLERFNPAFLDLRDGLAGPAPERIVVHRCGPYRPTGVDVIGDLMVHDLDLLLDVVAAPIVDVAAHGGFRDDTIDSATARITFGDGTIARVHTCHRVEPGHRRRRFCTFTGDGAAGADLLNRTTWGLETAQGRDLTVDPMRVQIAAFIDAVRSDGPSPVPPSAVLPALALAERIRSLISERRAGRALDDLDIDERDAVRG